jgi:hypothetical protein
MNKKRDISDFPTMLKQCSTCPFLIDENGRHQNPELVSRIQKTCISEASQICHHPALEGKPQTHLCRGARNYQLQIFYKLGVLDAPTDESWGKTWNRFNGGFDEHT